MDILAGFSVGPGFLLLNHNWPVHPHKTTGNVNGCFYVLMSKDTSDLMAKVSSLKET